MVNPFVPWVAISTVGHVMTKSPNATQLPEPIQRRLATLQQEIDQVILRAQGLLITRPPGRISFIFKNRAPRDVLTPKERAQSISFVTRFEHLPAEDPVTVKLVERKGEWCVGNMASLRHALNEFRPLIQNEEDSVYYKEIHRVWYGMLMLDDASKGTTIRAMDVQNNDVTPIFTQYLRERNKAITYVLKPLDYKYLYNGILQHSVEAYSERFVRDYTSGEINYILWKHVHVLSFIREMLRPYNLLISILTNPKQGPL